jgi:hypothetical protein
MALFIRQDDARSELQERLAAELQARAKQKALQDRPDGVDDSEYIKGTKLTTNFAWIWILLALIIIGVLIWLTVMSMSR